MPFKPGNKKALGHRSSIKGLGQRDLEQICRDVGVNIFELLAQFAKGDWKALGYKAETYIVYGVKEIQNEQLYIQPEMRLKAASEAAQYLYPKLKSVEHKKSNPWDSMNPTEKLEAVKKLYLDLEKEVNGS